MAAVGFRVHDCLIAPTALRPATACVGTGGEPDHTVKPHVAHLLRKLDYATGRTP